jgi:molybdopterin/thiamine biosynthesis adenylyltransferase
MPDLRTHISREATDRRRPDGTAYRSLPTEAVERLSGELAVTPGQIERTALEAGIVPERYTRNMATLSPEDQHRLLASTACIVGMGGLGGHVAEILARIGVGRLRLVDGDRFEDSNLNRQRFADLASLGRFKVATAREQIAAINPAVEVVALAERLSDDNGPAILGDANIAVDCLDTLQARRYLQTACRNSKIPMVSAAVAGVSGQIAVIHPEDQGLAALYGDLASAPDRGAETTLGNLPYAVAMLASLECSEAVKTLLGRDSTLHGRLLIFDLADLSFEVIQLEESV